MRHMKNKTLKEFNTDLLNTEEYIKYVEYMKYESCFLLKQNDKKYLATLNNGECIICLIENDFIQYLYNITNPQKRQSRLII